MTLDLQQFAAVLLPLPSSVFYPISVFPRQTLENSGKQNPKGCGLGSRLYNTQTGSIYVWFKGFFEYPIALVEIVYCILYRRDPL